MIKWVRRRPALAGLLAASLIAALATVGLAVAIPLYLRTVAAQQETERQRVRAEAAGRQAARYEYLFRIALTERYWREGDLIPAREMMSEATRSPYRNWEWFFLHRLLSSSPDAEGLQESRLLGRHDGPVRGVAACPREGAYVSGGADGTVRIWEASGPAPSRILASLDQPIRCLAVSRDGRFVAAAGGDPAASEGESQEVRVWSLATGREILRKGAIPSPIRDLAVSADGTRLAALFQGEAQPGGVMLWDVSSGDELLVIRQPVRRLALSDDGSLVAGIVPGAERETVKIWDASSRAVTFELEWAQTYEEMDALTFSPDAQHLLIVEGSVVHVWHVRAGVWLLRLAGHSGDVRAIAFSPDRTRLATASDDGTIKIWDWERHRLTTPLPYHSNHGRYWRGESGPALDGAGTPFPAPSYMAPYSRHHVAGQQDRTDTPLLPDRASMARYWRGTTWAGPHVQALLTLRGQSVGDAVPVSSVTFTRNGHAIVSGYEDGSIRLFEGTPPPEDSARRKPG
jgi:WD40 repeat protein